MRGLKDDAGQYSESGRTVLKFNTASQHARSQGDDIHTQSQS